MTIEPCGPTPGCAITTMMSHCVLQIIYRVRIFAAHFATAAVIMYASIIFADAKSGAAGNFLHWLLF